MPLLEQVLEKYPKQVKLVFKNFPLRNHRYAKKAATAALAANRQGKFWEFHDRLMENATRLNDKKIEDIAKELGYKPRSMKLLQERAFQAEGREVPNG